MAAQAIIKQIVYVLNDFLNGLTLNAAYNTAQTAGQDDSDKTTNVHDHKNRAVLIM